MVTPEFLKRYEGNPVLSAKDIPYEAVLIFNAGICKYQGKYVMCFRNDYGLDEEEFRIKEHPVETNIGIALSDDGIHWRRSPEPLIRNGAPGSLDSRHAHKPCVIYHNGTLYHFYCAVRPTETEEERRKFGKEFRCLTVARSTPF